MTDAWRNRIFAHSSMQMPELPDKSISCCVTSPPYWGLRNYGSETGGGIADMIGFEPSLDSYIENLVNVFREVKRVLRDDGTVWCNLGDAYSAQCKGSYAGQDKSGLTSLTTQVHGSIQFAKKVAGLKNKDLIGIPWRVAFALQADGWYLRSDIIWHKPNPMPSSVLDRPTSAHEYVFLLSKSRKYYYDADAIREPLAASSVERLSQDVEHQQGSDRANAGGKTNGAMKAVSKRNDFERDGSGPRHTQRGQQNAVRFGGNKGGENPTYSGNPWTPGVGANKRDVWTIATAGFRGPHYAVMPRALVLPCILAGSPPDGIVLDPFLGSGTVADVALGCGRSFVGYDVNPEYCDLARERLGLWGGRE